ncbi:histone-lysine N-methyltransferase SETMAR [Trichonephila clavipes]|nr:histone-lysine N-methyltransferase SETMAR [Trichonephila clavipes]
MITNFFIPELNNHDVQELWFQQDDATCHTARATIDLLKHTFGDRLISRFGPVNWPPRSCDLTPLDYFLPVVENVNRITEIIEVDCHFISRSIAQELKIDHKTVLNHLLQVGFKKKLYAWGPHQLTPKNMIDRISICKALAKWNEIDRFLYQMVTGDEKWVTYYNAVRKRSWSK